MDNQFAVHLFGFSGSAEMSDERTEKSDYPRDQSVKERNALNHLNSVAEQIAQEIRRRLRAKLLPGTDVEVDIEFVQGSIEWLGTVAFFQIASGLATTASLVTSISKAIEFVITRVVKQHASGMRQAHTTVTPPAVATVEPPVATTRPPATFRVQEWLTYINTALLTIILFILIYATMTASTP